MPVPDNCPCGTGAPYEMCCGMYHNNPGTAPTAEALMRSRYSAFALGKFNYIASTQKLKDSPKQSEKEIQDCSQTTVWQRLEILETEGGMERDKEGVVSFCAHFQEGKHLGKLKERSLFKRVKKQWFYIGGEHDIEKSTPIIKNESVKIGRNDPCFCGSGKKYKKCCA